MKICFVLLHAFPVVEPNAPGVFGGSETRAVTIAQGLAKQTDHEVCFVVRNPQLKKPRMIEGVTYLPWRDFWAETRVDVAAHLDIHALPKMCIKRWSWKLLWKIPLLILSYPWQRKYREPRQAAEIFGQIDADVYCSFGINAHAVRTVYNAKKLNRSSLIFLGHDGDLDERFEPESDYISPTGDRAEPSYWVLKNADYIIAQSESQQQKLKSQFDRDSEILANPFDFDDWKKQSENSIFNNPWGEKKYVLWIGRADSFHKMPVRFVELALRCPTIKFLMIMNPSDPDVEKQIKQQAPENLKIIDSVRFTEMPGIFREAKAYVNTSVQEGFPNVFLQAIASQVPILSYEVGEEFLQQSQAGICVQNDATVASSRLLDDSLVKKTNFDVAISTLRENYLCSSVCQKLEEIIKQLVE